MKKYSEIINVTYNGFKGREPLEWSNCWIDSANVESEKRILLIGDSTVRMITSNYEDNKLSVVINGYNGNIREYRDGYLLIDGVSNYNKISVGDKVYTSGLGVLDKGLFIGNVSDILEDSYGIDNILYVTVPSFENISYVMVLAHD